MLTGSGGEGKMRGGFFKSVQSVELPGFPALCFESAFQTT